MPTYFESLMPHHSPVLGTPTKRLNKTDIFMAVEEAGWQDEEKP